MANFDEDGELGRFIQQIEDMGLYDEDMQKEILFSCGDILVADIKAKFTSDWNTHDTFAHTVCKHSIKKDKDGVPFVTATVDGTRDDGQRYAAVAFVLNYGRKEEYGHIEGSHFWNRATEDTEGKMKECMEDALMAKLHEKGLS